MPGDLFSKNPVCSRGRRSLKSSGGQGVPSLAGNVDRRPTLFVLCVQVRAGSDEQLDQQFGPVLCGSHERGPLREFVPVVEVGARCDESFHRGYIPKSSSSDKRRLVGSGVRRRNGGEPHHNQRRECIVSCTFGSGGEHDKSIFFRYRMMDQRRRARRFVRCQARSERTTVP
jgi:hypothetical protein